MASRADGEPWNHNGHYHSVILAAIPPDCARALDIGCGQGRLTRRLRTRVPAVTGLDRDERSLRIARAHPGAGDIDYVCGDFRAAPFAVGSFDLVTAVASVHHMDTGAALRRMAELLRPGGTLVVVGLARGPDPAGVALLVPAIVGTRAHLLAAAARRQRRPAYTSPVVWPPPLTYREVRQLAHRLLPGVSYRRHLYWRYSLTWHKPR